MHAVRGPGRMMPPLPLSKLIYHVRLRTPPPPQRTDGTDHVIGKPCFCPLPKRARFDENGENDEFAFYPLKTRASLLRPPKTTKVTKTLNPLFLRIDLVWPFVSFLGNVRKMAQRKSSLVNPLFLRKYIENGFSKLLGGRGGGLKLAVNLANC